MVYFITSPKYGLHTVKLDISDYHTLKDLGGKWSLAKRRDNFYVEKRIKHQLIMLHRFLLNPKKEEYVDHINGNTLDNTRQNLRICSNAANLRNGSLRTNNTSGYKGVSFDKARNKWSAYIKVNYRKLFLGRFDTLEKAIENRKLAEKEYWT